MAENPLGVLGENESLTETETEALGIPSSEPWPSGALRNRRRVPYPDAEATIATIMHYHNTAGTDDITRVGTARYTSYVDFHFVSSS